LACSSSECRAGGQDRQVLEGRRGDEVLGRQRPQLEAQHLVEELVGGQLQFVGGGAEQVLGRIGLRIEVDHQGARAAGGGNGGEVAGDGALADAPLLVEHDALHDGLPNSMESGDSATADAALRPCRLVEFRNGAVSLPGGLSFRASPHAEPDRDVQCLPNRKTFPPNQRDLALAYSPGVAAACNAIVADPAMASRLTSRANLVAWSPTAPRCWAWATSGRWPPSR
jgi:hypothetical protein